MSAMTRQYKAAREAFNKKVCNGYPFGPLHSLSCGYQLSWALEPLEALLTAAEAAHGRLYAYSGLRSFYLSRAQGFIERILTQRSDRLISADGTRGLTDTTRGVVLPAWQNTTNERELGDSVLFYQSLITAPIYRFCHLIYGGSRYSELRTNQLYHCIEDCNEALDTFDNEYVLGPNDGEAYAYCHNRPQHPAPINGIAALCRAYLYRWLATGEVKFKERATCLARYISRRMFWTDDGRLLWRYWPRERTEMDDYTGKDRIEDIEHAAITMRTAYECARAGIVFEDASIAALAKTYSTCLRCDATGLPLGWVTYLDESAEGSVGHAKAIFASQLAGYDGGKDLNKKLLKWLRDPSSALSGIRLPLAVNLMATSRRPRPLIPSRIPW